MATSQSQLGADDWVLSIFNDRAGFFVDIGCGDGHLRSNTYKLEWNGWRGICVDPLARNFDDRPRSVVEDKAVYSHPTTMEFVVAKEKDYSGFVDCLDRHKDRVLGMEVERRWLETVTLNAVLEEYGAPSFIHYLSLDTEGSEYDILSAVDFQRYRFGVLTVQHNYEESKRWSVFNILRQHGYRRVRCVKWDDWYAHESMVGCIPDVEDEEY